MQLGARRVQLDEDDGKFAVLAGGQIHLAVQLVLEVRAPVQAGSRVAHRLVGDLAAQAVVGTLLLLDLVQRSAQLLFALALGGLVEPDRRQPAAALGVRRAEHTQHGKLMPHAAPFKVVVAEQRRAMRDGGLLRGAQGHGHRGVEEIGITAAQQFVLGLAQKTHHRGADMRVAAGFQVLDGQQATPLVHQRRHGRAQHRREVGSGQDRGVHLVRGDVHAVHAFGRFPGGGVADARTIAGSCALSWWGWQGISMPHLILAPSLTPLDPIKPGSTGRFPSARNLLPLNAGAMPPRRRSCKPRPTRVHSDVRSP